MDKILSFAPTKCGLSVPVPKTTDVKDSIQRKWTLEEAESDADSGFYHIDRDLQPVKQIDLSNLSYKDPSVLITDKNGTLANPGLNIFCVDNTKQLSLEEYVSLTQLNKKYKVTVQQKERWGDVEVVPIWTEGKMPDGFDLKEPGYLAVSKDRKLLLYIRLWSENEKDPIAQKLNKDGQLIIRNLKYR
jgi:hypothetical protein